MRSISISIPIIGLLGIVLIFCLVRFRSQTASGLPAPDGGTLPKPNISFTEAATKRSHPDDQVFSPSLSENSGDAGPDAVGVDPEDIPSITDREKLLEIGFMWTEANSDRLQEKFNFSDSDLTYVKDQASHLATSIISLAKSNLREDYFRHRPEKGVYAYRLPAFKGRAERNRDLVEALSQRFGAAKGERIASMILGDRERLPPFRVLGEYELLFRLQLTNIGDYEWVTERYNPVTGALVNSGEGGTFEGFLPNHGPIVSLPGL
ncbi:MAG TPA: hypothetical protein VMN36_03505 [Verrucomicrobiales bacterium]|nr:hypothetical protein [Verrucomicrobiales bacterium]